MELWVRVLFVLGLGSRQGRAPPSTSTVRLCTQYTFDHEGPALAVLGVGTDLTGWGGTMASNMGWNRRF